MRLDVFLHQNGLAKSREYAKKIIEGNLVEVDGTKITKASFSIRGDEDVRILGELFPYVGRGGLKLKAAIDAFSIDAGGKVCIDIGSTSGGFVDCLLQHGAKRVYAVDCGKDQLDPSLRNREDVVVMEQFNARALKRDSLSECCDMATMDVSFISQTLLYEGMCNVLEDMASVVCLIKPQFECGPKLLGKGGIVRDRSIHKEVIKNVLQSAQHYGLTANGLIRSPITGGDGNTEFLEHADLCWADLT